jgi:hypothetical protein
MVSWLLHNHVFYDLNIVTTMIDVIKFIFLTTKKVFFVHFAFSKK